MALDLTGNITLTLEVTTLFLLILGLPLARSVNSMKNLGRHGYLTVVALMFQTILILLVMVPSFVRNINPIISLSPAYSLNTWLHVAAGVFAEMSGFFFVAFWLWFSRPTMRCAKLKKYMMPTFIIWIVAIISGALIHILQMF